VAAARRLGFTGGDGGVLPLYLAVTELAASWSKHGSE